MSQAAPIGKPHRWRCWHIAIALTAARISTSLRGANPGNLPRPATYLVAPIATSLFAMLRPILTLLLPLTVCAGLAGCRLWSTDALVTDRQTLLRAVNAPPEAIPLDIYWARFPWGNEALNDDLWLSIREDRIPVDVRQRLAANGLRAGVLSGLPPHELAKLLEGDSGPTGATEDVAATPIIEQPRVERRLVHLQPGQVKQEDATELLDEATLLVNRHGELGGRTYQQVQGVYSFVAAPTGTSRARIELTPEVVHGEPRLKWQQSQPGVMVQSVARERDVFDELTLHTELAPGEMLVVMGHVDSRGLLGSLLHSEQSASERQQKVLLIRMSQQPPTDLATGDERTQF